MAARSTSGKVFTACQTRCFPADILLPVVAAAVANTVCRTVLTLSRPTGTAILSGNSTATNLSKIPAPKAAGWRAIITTFSAKATLWVISRPAWSQRRWKAIPWCSATATSAILPSATSSCWTTLFLKSTGTAKSSGSGAATNTLKKWASGKAQKTPLCATPTTGPRNPKVWATGYISTQCPPLVPTSGTMRVTSAFTPTTSLWTGARPTSSSSSAKRPARSPGNSDRTTTARRNSGPSAGSSASTMPT